MAIDREFQVHARGFVRDSIVLANFREGLRQLTNPETGLPFSNDEIRRATQPKSRWFAQAQAIDDVVQNDQRGALWLNDQVRIERASTAWLEQFHGPLWGLGRLPASGASGKVTVRGTPGTIVLGSTLIGGPAYTARDPAGNVYQVFITTEIGVDGTVKATLAAVTQGASTNIPPGTKLTWITRDPSIEATADVLTQFTGGTNDETDADYASRIAAEPRHKPGAGNDAQIRAWARTASNAVEEGFVYPCALHAGSTIVAITQKRSSNPGPLARLPSTATLAAAIAYLTPPASPVVPPRAFFVVTPPQSEPVDFSLQLVLAKASTNGWTDTTPWPSYHATAPAVSSIVSPTVFRFSALADTTLPGGVTTILSGADAPGLMIWRETTSRFEALNVQSVEKVGSFTYEVTTTDTPTIAVGDVISPRTDRNELIAQALESYFDELGTGDLFDLSADIRGARTVRFPLATEERPFRVGAVIATRAIEALGGLASDAVLGTISQTVPSFPTDLVAGPHLLTLGSVGIYELT